MDRQLGAGVPISIKDACLILKAAGAMGSTDWVYVPVCKHCWIAPAPSSGCWRCANHPALPGQTYQDAHWRQKAAGHLQLLTIGTKDCISWDGWATLTAKPRIFSTSSRRARWCKQSVVSPSPSRRYLQDERGFRHGSWSLRFLSYLLQPM